MLNLAEVIDNDLCQRFINGLDAFSSNELRDNDILRIVPHYKTVHGLYSKLNIDVIHTDYEVVSYSKLAVDGSSVKNGVTDELYISVQENKWSVSMTYSSVISDWSETFQKHIRSLPLSEQNKFIYSGKIDTVLPSGLRLSSYMDGEPGVSFVRLFEPDNFEYYFYGQSYSVASADFNAPMNYSFFEADLKIDMSSVPILERYTF